MTQNNNNPFYAAPSEAADFERLDDGAYNGCCVGVTARDFPDYNDPSVMVTKIQYIFQVAEGGQTYYFPTKPMKNVINEKSNLFILINTWTGATMDRMLQGFNCDKMVGYGAQLVINTTTGKDGKQYANLANVLKLKKGVKVAPVQDAIPAYLVKDCTAQILAEGITVKAPEVAKAPAAPAAAMPFHQNPAAPVANQGLSVTQPAPAPASAQVETAPEVDDDSDLPF